jgi:uncharacterized membrane protein
VTKYLIAYAATLIVMVAGDFTWLGFIAKGLYAGALGPLIAEKPNLGAAAAFYLIYALGVVIFAEAPALRSGSWSAALIYGALFGFFVYASYDLTNLAVLRGWPASPLAFDLPWGTVISGVVALAGYGAARKFIG